MPLLDMPAAAAAGRHATTSRKPGQTVLARANGQARTSAGDGLENAPGFLKVLQIARRGAASQLIEPADRRRFQAGLGRAVGRVHHFDFHLHRILTALDPAFALFSSLAHDMPYSGKP